MDPRTGFVLQSVGSGTLSTLIFHICSLLKNKKFITAAYQIFKKLQIEITLAEIIEEIPNGWVGFGYDNNSYLVMGFAWL